MQLLQGTVRRRVAHAEDTAGLGDDQFHELERELCRKAAQRFREDVQSLLADMDEGNAPRVFSLVEDLAVRTRDWTSKLNGAEALREHQHLDSIGSTYSMDSETFGARALEQMLAIFTKVMGDQQLVSMLKSKATAQETGDSAVVAALNARIAQTLGAPTPALPEESESLEPAVVDSIPAGEEVVLS